LLPVKIERRGEKRLVKKYGWTAKIKNKRYVLKDRSNSLWPCGKRGKFGSGKRRG